RRAGLATDLRGTGAAVPGTLHPPQARLRERIFRPALAAGQGPAGRPGRTRAPVRVGLSAASMVATERRRDGAPRDPSPLRVRPARRGRKGPPRPPRGAPAPSAAGPDGAVLGPE